MPKVVASLPVRAVLPDVGAALKRSRRVVLVAPPGSGKTTLVAPWLLDSGLVPKGEIIVLQPRRVAARSVARFMADMRGERVGETVGFQVRFEQEVSAKTRIRVVTEGILTARLQASPDLAGVAAVVLDEFHERSIHADLALALLKEVQDVLRDDLLVIVMSATLDAAPIAAFFGDCEIVRADGRAFDVTTAFADEGLAIGPGTHPRDVEARMAKGVLELIDQVGDGARDGDVLGFLPGVRLIEGTRQRLLAPLAQRGFDVEVLHGSLGPREQDLVLSPGPRPRVVLATNIAETSLTIPGVRAVVDSGLAKVMRYDLAVGSGRLETGRISRASADQRRGRAGRLGPGRCLRLWTRFEDERLAAFEAPEIRRVDLARMVIELASWGADPMAFAYYEAPDARALEDARRRLVLMGALDARMKLTALGKAIAEVPSDPRVAAFLVAVAARAPKSLDEAASWAAVLDGGEANGDLGEEVRRAGRLPHIERASRQLAARAKQAGSRVGSGARAELRELMLAGYADRVGARREGAKYALVGGRLGELDTPIAGDYVLALELEAGRRGEGATSRILSYTPIDRAWLEAHPQYRVADELVWDAGERRVVAFRTAFFVDLALERKSVPNRDRERSGEILAERAALALGEVFGGLGEEDDNLLARLATLSRINPELGLPVGREAWLTAALPAMAAGLSSFGELIRKPTVSLSQALVASLGWEVERRLREELPERLEVPSGSHLKLAYSVDGLPALAVKIQEVFGLQTTPTVARGRLPVVMHLLSPGGRPLQVTSDLASFWTRTWPEVRSEMRSRYPKHHWPEDPARALPSARTRDKKLKPEGASD